MKKYIYITVLCFATLVSSCDKRDCELPAISTPKYETASEIITIAQLKALAEPKIMGSTAAETNNNFGYLSLGKTFEAINEKGDTVDVRQIVPFDSIVTGKKAIKGIIVGNDESGNIYKQFYLQDETGAILVVVNLTGVFSQFPVGQEVIVELEELCVGKYYQAYQLGAPTLTKSTASSGKFNWGMSRMTPYYFYNHVFRNGTPDLIKVNSLCKTYTSIPASTEEIRNTLVRFDNVSFGENAGSQFAPLVGGKPATGTVQLTVNGKKIDLRTSGYANFASDTVPAGTGSITAILSQYFENLQITLRSKEDLKFNN